MRCLLETAREIFLRDGATASTATIARHAGVSEGTLFKRFGTKEALFHRALCPPEWTSPLEERVGAGDVAEQLAEVIAELVTFQREMMPCMVMLIAHTGFDPREQFRDASTPAGPKQVLRRLADYIAEEIRLGRLAPVDPTVAAKMILGATRSFAFFETHRRRRREPIQSRGLRPRDGEDPQ